MVAMVDMYALFGFKVGSTVIDGIQSVAVDPQTRESVFSSAGFADPSVMLIPQQSPVIDFSTIAVETILGLTFLTPATFTDAKTLFQKVTKWGTREAAAATTHEVQTLKTGMLVLNSIRATPSEVATANCRFWLASDDGVNKPIASATGAFAAVDATMGVVSEGRVLGAVTIDGTELPEVDEMEISTGIQVVMKTNNRYPTWGHVTQRRPVISFKTYDLSLFRTWTDAIGYHQQSGVSASSIVLEKLKPMGDRTGANDITLTLNEGIMGFRRISGDANQEASGQVVYTPLWDGTNALIVKTGP